MCDETTNTILHKSEKLYKSNHQTIAKLFNASMSLLWPNDVKHGNVLLFVSDVAPYVVIAGKLLSRYPDSNCWKFEKCLLKLFYKQILYI